ncbi:MAG: T9SS type A sorting domain-containing protein [Cryomorphaceae bacterium]|nr:T9SS type A sorting domain-containing protein [Cryomorphaceae bacterium]
MITDRGSYLAKYDESGTLVWQSLYECVQIIDIDMDSKGDIYFTGEKHFGCDHMVNPFLNLSNTNNVGATGNQGFVFAKVNGADGVCDFFEFWEGVGSGHLTGNALTIDKDNDILYVAIQPYLSSGSTVFGTTINETTIFRIDDVNNFPFVQTMDKDMSTVVHPIDSSPSIIGFPGGGIAQIEYHDGFVYGTGWGPNSPGVGPRMNGAGTSEVFIFDENLSIHDFEDFDANAFNIKIWPRMDDLVLAVCGIFEDNATIASHAISGTYQHGFLAAWEVTSHDLSNPIPAKALNDDPNTYYTTGIIPFSMDYNERHLLVSSVGSSQFINAYALADSIYLSWDEMALDNSSNYFDFATGISYGNEIGSQRSADIAYQPTLERFIFIGNNNSNEDMVFGSTTFSPISGVNNNNTYIVAIEDQFSNGHWRLQNETFNEIDLNVFPNPTSGILQLSSSIETQIIISTLEGKTVLKQNMIIGENTLDLSFLSSGLYLLRDEENKIPIKKITISK